MKLNLIRKKYEIGSLLILSIFLFSCQKNEVYFQYRDINAEGWAQDSVLSFDMDSTILKPFLKYDIHVAIQSSIDYRYQNLWLFIDSDLGSDSVKLVKKELFLADEKGNWNGSGFAFIYSFVAPIENSVMVKQQQEWHMKIRHGMKDEYLKGVEKVGVKIERQ